MSPAPTRRHALLGTASIALISGLGGVLLPNSAFACHSYKSKSDGQTGCAAYKRDQAGGASSGASSKTASKPQTTSTASSDTQESSGDPEVSGRTIRVSSSSQLRSALASAGPGNRIELANGTYSGNFAITTSGTKSNPILIESASRLGAELRSDLDIRGDHVVVSGLSFKSAAVNLRAHNCRVTRCYFNGGGTTISVRGADNAEIDHNEITNWSGRGVDFDPEEERRQGLRPHIYRNYFHDSKGASDNTAIGIGQHSRHHSFMVGALVEYNLCINIPGYKGIFCKSSGNTIRYNTMIDCQGMVNRHGYKNKYIGNWLENSLDLIINDDDCLAEGNKLINCKNGLRIMAGNITSSQVPSQNAGYPYADGCQIINNETSLIQVGMTYSGWKRTYPALNTILSGNTGRVKLQTERGTKIASSGQSSAGKAAVKLRPNQVGPRS